jgi:hypothetical protein
LAIHAETFTIKLYGITYSGASVEVAMFITRCPMMFKKSGSWPKIKLVNRNTMNKPTWKQNIEQKTKKKKSLHRWKDLFSASTGFFPSTMMVGMAATRNVIIKTRPTKNAKYPKMTTATFSVSSEKNMPDATTVIINSSSTRQKRMSWNKKTFHIFSMPFLTEFTGEGATPV